MQSTVMAKLFGDKEDPRVRLQALFGGTLPPGGQPPEAAVTWARGVLNGGSGAGSRAGSSDLVATVGELRKADKRLTLKAANFLARHLERGE